jgi:hypothetical protein
MATKKKITATTVVDYAFHMPITAREQKIYKAIARLVASDEYRPVGYRKPKHQHDIVNNRRAYE